MTDQRLQSAVEIEKKPAKISRLPGPRLGLAMAAGGVLFALGAWWPPLAMLGLVWWLALAVTAAFDLALLRAAAEISAQREVARVLSLGAPNRVVIALRNRTPVDFKVLLRDEPPLDFKTARLRLRGELPAGGACRRDYHTTPQNRGDFAFGRLNVRVRARFGLLAAQLTFELGFAVKVYPNLQDVRALELAARKERLIDIGIRASRIRGTGLEFESLRAYVPGDEPRRIDWKASARRAELITRDYDIERSQHIIICIDLGRTMSSRLGLLTKADHAVNAAVPLAHIAARAGDWVGIFAFAEQADAFLPPRKHHFSTILETLYALQPRGVESNYYQSFLEASRRFRKRGLVVLFTDLIDPDSSGRLLKNIRLLSRRHLVLCAALSDYELYDLARKSPQDPHELYERAVATELLADRKRALERLREQGAIAFDATPEKLSVAVLNHYLEIKQRTLV